MTRLHSIAFCLFALALLPPVVYGLVYLVRGRFMPYHEAALGRPWEDLDLRLQTLLIGLLKVIGGCMLSCSVAGYILLWIPFRESHSWANWVLFVIVSCGGLPAVYSTFLIQARTGAATPRVPAVIVVATGVVAFALAEMSS